MKTLSFLPVRGPVACAKEPFVREIDKVGPPAMQIVKVGFLLTVSGGNVSFQEKPSLPLTDSTLTFCHSGQPFVTLVF